MKKTGIFIIVMLLSGMLYAGEGDSSLVLARNQIRVNLAHLFRAGSDSVKDSVNLELLKCLRQTLTLSLSFEYPFDSVPHIGIIRSSDNKVKLYNWNIQWSDGSFTYYCFVQTLNSKEQVVTTELNDKSFDITDPETANLDPDNWFGALYYEIVTTKARNEIYYTLLGWDGNDDYSKKKVIEIMYFSKNGKPKFGKTVFKMEGSKRKRVIFEYSYLANMSLRYNEEIGMIVFDHLAPPKPSLTGQYRFYGPDFTFDGLALQDGKWIIQQNIDIRNPKGVKKKQKKISLKF